MSFYKYQAETVLKALPQKSQLAIEYLRKNTLSTLIKSGQAHPHNTLHHPPEYRTDILTYNVTLYYYEQYTFPKEIVIFQIDHPIKPNGHKKHP